MSRHFTAQSSSKSERSTLEREGSELRIFTLLCLLSGGAYFAILMLALLGFLPPARWLAGMLSGTWSVPLLWGVAIGGPLLGVLGSLILSSGHRSAGRFDTFFGGIGVVLLILNLISCVPFPFILAVE